MITDRYLYKLEWGNNTRNVFPIEDGAGIVYEKEDYMAYFRAKFNGSLIFVNDHKSGTYDFSTIYTAQWYDVFTIYVYRTSRSTAPIFTGQFRKYDGVFDTDKCTFTVTPSTLDEYSCIIYKGEDEMNIVSSVPGSFTVSHYLAEDEYESKTDNSGILPLPAQQIPVPIPNVLICVQNQSLNTYGWTYYRTYIGNVNSNGYIAYVEQRRDVKYTYTNVSPSGSYWAQDVDWVTTGGVYKWVRPYKGLNPNLQNPYVPSGDGYIISSTLLPVSSQKEYTERCKKLDDVIAMFAGNCDLDYRSDFFQNSTNYVFDEIGYPLAVPNTVNPLNNLMLLPKSELSNKSDAATKVLLKFIDLMRLLYDMFQVKWFIENGELRIEHQSYFDALQGEDLTSADYINYIKAKNKWSYEFQDVKAERWKFTESENTDFVGFPIEYTNLAPNLQLYRDSEIIEHNVDSITTDIELAFAKPDSLSKDGWFMFQVYFNNGEYEVGQDIGQYTGQYGYNRLISLANLHYYFWRHDRLFPYGQMNDTFTTFLSSRKVKIQVELTIPSCDIDVNKLVKTELGWGEIREATEDFKTRTIKLVVAYD